MNKPLWIDELKGFLIAWDNLADSCRDMNNNLLKLYNISVVINNSELIKAVDSVSDSFGEMIEIQAKMTIIKSNIIEILINNYGDLNLN